MYPARDLGVPFLWRAPKILGGGCAQVEEIPGNGGGVRDVDRDGHRAVAPAAEAAVGPVGAGFTVTAGDLSFILKQIKIAERHAATLDATHPCSTLLNAG